MSKVLIVAEGQNIIDIAIQLGGCYEFVFDLLEDNQFVDLNNMVDEGGVLRELRAGDVLTVRNEIPQYNERNQAVANYFKANGATVNSGWKEIAEMCDNDYSEDDYVECAYVGSEPEDNDYVSGGYVESDYVN
jgi:hypothetical protein